jgi:hypothetical protein
MPQKRLTLLKYLILLLKFDSGTVTLLQYLKVRVLAAREHHGVISLFQNY